MNKRTLGWLALIAAFALLVVLRSGVGGGRAGAAPIPELFNDGHTLAQARALSTQTGRPVFAFATADWCGPCQALKRDALSDLEVAAFLAERTIPVYLEESKSPEALAELAPRVYPTTFLIRNGETIARVEGGGPPAAYLNTIRRALE